jgi:hypothetical protein
MSNKLILVYFLKSILALPFSEKTIALRALSFHIFVSFILVFARFCLIVLGCTLINLCKICHACRFHFGRSMKRCDYQTTREYYVALPLVTSRMNIFIYILVTCFLFCRQHFSLFMSYRQPIFEVMLS